MKTIPESVVQEAWTRCFEASPEQARALAQRMQQEQPNIMIYLLAADEECLEEEDRGELMTLGAWIWSAMSQGDKPLRRVEEDELLRAEEANIRVLEELEDTPEIAWKDAVQSFMSGYNQMPLLGAVIEALMAGHEEQPQLAPDWLGLALLYLKTVIDCLDQ